MRHTNRDPTRLGAALSAVILVLLVLLGTVFFHFQSGTHQKNQIENIQEKLDAMASALQNRIYANILKFSGLSSVVAMNPDLTQDDFSRAIKDQFRDPLDVRNIVMARDRVVQYLYPVAGNEAAMGLDYTRVPDQLETINLAISLNQIVLAGPLELVQGGEAIIARIPVHITDAALNEQTFWGVASVVINTDTIFSRSGITDSHPTIKIAIRGRDGKGSEGDVFFGDPSVFDHNPVTHSIQLPHGTWQIGASPTSGWNTYSALSDPLMWTYLAVSITILAFTAIIVWLFSNYNRAVRTLERERNLFAEGPVFSIEWIPEQRQYWQIISVSSNIETILGYSPAEMLQPELYYQNLVHPADWEHIINTLERNIANGIDRFEESYRLKTKMGHYLWVNDFNIVLRDDTGQVTGIRSYIYDQSARKLAEEALHLAQQRLEKTAYDLTENIPIGTYTVVQPADGSMPYFSFMSSRFLQLLGLTRQEVDADPMRPFTCVHPPDLDAWMALVTQSLEDKKPFFGETRVLVDDDIRWITAESFPRPLSDGTTIWEGVLADITERKRTEQALSESLRRFDTLISYLTIGVYVVWHRADGHPEFEYVSDSWCAMNQIRREDVLADAQIAFSSIHPDDMYGFLSASRNAISERKRFTWEGRLIAGGQTTYVLIESNPVFFENGESCWFGIEQDIRDRKQAEAILQTINADLEKEVKERKVAEEKLKTNSLLLEKLSTQDGLTGISNRRHFDQRAQLEWKQSLRTGMPLALVMIDIDHFKFFNDHYGHGAGDECLRLVAQTLVKCCDRPKDLVARYGGEEFVALLPEITLSGALHVAEQMRVAVERLAIPHDHSSAAQVVTLSLGVATHEHERLKADLADLQRCADQALYEAKHLGRNQVQSKA